MSNSRNLVGTQRRAKVVVAKLGLDTHWRGAIIVAYMLRRAGMDVVYLGNAMPQQIIDAAVEEGADLVGVSSLGGAHLSLGLELIRLARASNLVSSAVFVMGGVIPPEDERVLRENGYDALFGPGTSEEAIVRTINEKLAEKKGQSSPS